MTSLLAKILQAKGEFRAKHGVDATHVFLSYVETNSPSHIYGLKVTELPAEFPGDFAVGLIETLTK
jgi:hypothetical protein